MNTIVFKIHKFDKQKSKSAEKQTNHPQLVHRLVQKNRQQQETNPIKKFQEYFGKVKPAFFRQLKNIFQKSQFQEQLSATKEIHIDYNAKSFALTSRHRMFNRQKYSLNEANNFTIQSINHKQLYVNAKLSKLTPSYKHNTINQRINEQQSQHDIEKQLFMKGIKSKMSSDQKNIKLEKVGKIIDKKRQNFLEMINLNNKQKFTTEDLSQILSYIHRINIQISSHFYYFNIYIEEGNNSDLLKNIVRTRTGWRIVQIPDNANLIWTQFYKKNILHKRLHKIQHVQIEEPKLKQKNGYSFRSKLQSTPKKINYQKYESQCKIPQNNNYQNQIKKLFTKNEMDKINNSRSNLLNDKKNIQITHNILVHNHFPQNNCITDKKNLLLHLKKYMGMKGIDVFQIIPESYQIKSQKIQDELMNKIKQYDYWLIKPGENSNRGRGIIITRNKNQTIQQITKKFTEDQNDKEKTRLKFKPKPIILQKYIIPFLYNNRKIDIRSYMLVTVINRQLRMYCYDQCYIRTSCKTFDINSSNKYVHLTNDAIQSNSNEYGKYEQGNKLSQAIFSKYIDEEYARANSVEYSIWSKLKQEMNQRCIQVIQASSQSLIKDIYSDRKIALQINQEQRYYFQLFGMDFMIDEAYKLWLIQVNTNPSIVHDCSKILNHLIPRMLQNTLFLAVQPFMKPIRFHQINIHNQYSALYKKNLK